jgi:hypothetical protein
VGLASNRELPPTGAALPAPQGVGQVIRVRLDTVSRTDRACVQPGWKGSLAPVHAATRRREPRALSLGELNNESI